MDELVFRSASLFDVCLELLLSNLRLVCSVVIIWMGQNDLTNSFCFFLSVCLHVYVSSSDLLLLVRLLYSWNTRFAWYVETVEEPYNFLLFLPFCIYASDANFCIFSNNNNNIALFFNQVHGGRGGLLKNRWFCICCDNSWQIVAENIDLEHHQLDHLFHLQQLSHRQMLVATCGGGSAALIALLPNGIVAVVIYLINCKILTPSEGRRCWFHFSVGQY
ncbi:hypothetical protein T08_10360 [Trichinella sp. T8]|nr:hypothetical protein T08_10360 [Trichinella sp. T8]